MAVSTATVGRETVFGDRKVTVTDVTFDGSYPTGGEPLSASALGLSSVAFVLPDGSADGFVFEYDYANETLKAFFADYDAAADGALIELPDTSAAVDGVTVRVLAVAQSA